jgi:hypothetical protein
MYILENKKKKKKRRRLAQTEIFYEEYLFFRFFHLQDFLRYRLGKKRGPCERGLLCNNIVSVLDFCVLFSQNECNFSHVN